MNRKFLTVSTVSLMVMLPCLSIAESPQNYLCTYSDMQRRVEILYETGMTLPCEVHYYKDTEAPGEKQVLWRAMNEANYCESKAQEFIVKLQDLGWSCGQNQEIETPAQADDTETLAPVAEPESDAEPEPAAEPEPVAELP